MTTAKEAAAQIERFSGLDKYPRGAERAAGLKELRIAAEAARTPELLRRVVDDWISSQRECPKPADLRRVIWERNEQEETEARRRTAECPECGGDGWIPVTNGDYQGVKACVCRTAAASIPAGASAAAELVKG